MNKLYFTRVVEKTRGLFTSSPRWKREKERETDRQTDRQTDREGERETETDRQTDRQTDWLGVNCTVKLWQRPVCVLCAALTLWTSCRE